MSPQTEPLGILRRMAGAGEDRTRQSFLFLTPGICFHQPPQLINLASSTVYPVRFLMWIVWNASGMRFAFTPIRIGSGATRAIRPGSRATGLQRNLVTLPNGQTISSPLNFHFQPSILCFVRNFARRPLPGYGNFPVRPRDWSFSIGLDCTWARLACRRSRDRDIREGSLT